jgi:uncharacterized protein (TIGR03437 family)
VIAPGEPIFLDGTNLATSTGSCGSFGNLPAACQGAALLIGGYRAAMNYASPTKIFAYVPFELDSASITIYVSAAGHESAPFYATVAPVNPATGDSGLTDSSSQAFAAGHPAHPGDLVLASLVGLGITNPALNDGQPPTPSPEYDAVAPIQVTVGGVPATVKPTKAQGGGTLSYLVQFYVPAGLSGNQPVIVTADGVSLAPITLPIAGSASPLSITSASNLGAFPLGEIQLPLLASGGTGSYTWSLASGALPPGLAIRGDVPAWITPYAPQGLIGIATTPGTYNFTLNVASGTATTSQAFTMKIIALVLVDGPTLPDASSAINYAYQLTATRNGQPVAITCTPATAAELSLSTGCKISGLPYTPGSLTIPVVFTDGTDSLQQNLALTVYTASIASQGLLPTASQGSSYSAPIYPSGAYTPYVYYLGGALPAGLTLNGTTISGTPTAPAGVYNFNITLVDALNHTYTKRMAIAVVASQTSLPQIASLGDLTDCSVGVGCPREITVTAGTPPFRWASQGLPPGMSARSFPANLSSYVRPADLELYGRPTAPGLYNISVTITDSAGLSTTQVFPLHVSPLLLDTCVSATSCGSLPDGAISTNYAAAFRVIGGTPPYTASPQASASGAGRPPFDLWIGSTAITGMPYEDGSFAPLMSFADSSSSPNLLLTSANLKIDGATTSTVSIDPVATQYISQGQPYYLQLTACCAAGLTWTLVSGQAPGGISLSSSGVLSGSTSAPAGIYYLFVQATDTGNSSNSSTRVILMAPSPMAVTTGGALPAGTVGKPYSEPLAVRSAIGTVSWALSPGQLLPPGLTLDSSGDITGRPSQAGAFGFSTIATDQNSNRIGGTFAMSVFSPCDINGNGTIEEADLAALFQDALGKSPSAHDLTGDGVVNVADLQNLIGVVTGSSCMAIFP